MGLQAIQFLKSLVEGAKLPGLPGDLLLGLLALGNVSSLREQVFDFAGFAANAPEGEINDNRSEPGLLAVDLRFKTDEFPCGGALDGTTDLLPELLP